MTLHLIIWVDTTSCQVVNFGLYWSNTEWPNCLTFTVATPSIVKWLSDASLSLMPLMDVTVSQMYLSSLSVWGGVLSSGI